MSWAEIRTATKLKLEGITGVENVLDYVVWTDDWNTIINLFADDDGRINTWMVGLANNNENTLQSGINVYNYLINILGYYSIKTNNQSSKTFEDIVMSIRDEFMKSFSYIKTFVATYAGHAITRPPNLIAVENTVYLQHPCHRAQIQIPVEETVAVSEVCAG